MTTKPSDMKPSDATSSRLGHVRSLPDNGVRALNRSVSYLESKLDFIGDPHRSDIIAARAELDDLRVALVHMREACRLLREAEHVGFSIDPDGFAGTNWEAYEAWTMADVWPADEPATHDPREEGI